MDVERYLPLGGDLEHPGQLSATYGRTEGVRYFHGCYFLGDDLLWGVNRRRKGGDHSLTAIKSIRAARPDGRPIYLIMDNLSANKTSKIRLDPGGWEHPSRLLSRDRTAGFPWLTDSDRPADVAGNPPSRVEAHRLHAY